MKSQFVEHVGDRIRKVRKQSGLTQEDFANQLQTDRTYLSRVESGRQKPSHTLLEAIKATYGVSLGWLLEGHGEWNARGNLDSLEVTNVTSMPGAGTVREGPGSTLAENEKAFAEALVRHYAPAKAEKSYGFVGLKGNTKLRLHAARDQLILEDAPALTRIIEEDPLWAALGDIQGWELEVLRAYLEEEGDREIPAWFEVIRFLRWTARRVKNTMAVSAKSAEGEYARNSKKSTG